jgi:hypothetical protein
MNISTVSPSTCDIRFSLQNRHAGDRLATALGKLGVSNSAVTISGRATRSEKTISEAEFVGADAAAIRATLTRFLTEHELPCANDLVILDMEPQRFAPRNLGDFEGRQQRDLVAAYRRRIRVARDVLRRKGVPGVRLGMYQVIVPDGRGRFTDEFERSMCGYLEAGRQGMYDELDFICPVLYQRFGPDDTTPETLRAWVAAAALPTSGRPSHPTAWLVNSRPCSRPSESPRSCSGRGGKPNTRWSRPPNRSSRSTSTTFS